MPRKVKEKSLIQRLEEAKSALSWSCECDGRGCGCCIGVDTISEAIQKLKLAPQEPTP